MTPRFFAHTILSVMLITRGDVPDQRFRERAAEPAFAPLVRIVQLAPNSASASGVLMPDGIVLTAAHVVAGKAADSLLVLVGGSPYRIRSVSVHPGWRAPRRVDLAAVRLERVPNHPVAILARTAPPLPFRALIAGFGIGGSRRSDSAGTARAGENVLDLRGGMRGDAADEGLLVGDFDVPGLGRINATGDSLPLAMEVLPTGGDSGGPVFIANASGALQLLAIYSHSGYRFDHWDAGQPSYAGSRFAVTDLTRYLSWLQAVGVSLPNPSSESP